MKIPCSSCGRRFQGRKDFMRCRRCRELAKVYGHQLHRRRGVEGYRNHRCPLCTKHKAQVRMLGRRWDRRGIYVWKQCSAKSHRWFHMGGNPDVCPTCAYETGMAYLKKMREEGVLR